MAYTKKFQTLADAATALSEQALENMGMPPLHLSRPN